MQMPADTIVTDRARAANSFIMSEAPKAYREGLLAALSLRRACDNHGTIARWVLVFVIR